MSTGTRVLSLVLLGALLAGCASGPRAVRSEPPGMLIEDVRRAGDVLMLGVLLDNPNDHPIVTRGIRMQARVEGQFLFETRWALAREVGPRGRERLRLEVDADPAGLARLARLDGRPGASVRYQLDAVVELEGMDDAERSGSGFLHPVPGQPGHYR